MADGAIAMASIIINRSTAIRNPSKNSDLNSWAMVGRPTIRILESIPTIKTPTVVTVRTVHLYCIGEQFVRFAGDEFE
jgi:hypothetical protein